LHQFERVPKAEVYEAKLEKGAKNGSTPTTGLDLRTRTQMWSTIRRLVDTSSTVLLTTQYLDEADQPAERIAVIDKGFP